MREPLETMWEQVKAKVKGSIPIHCYRMWIDPLIQKPNGGDRIILMSPNEFSRKRVMTNYLELIGSEIRAALGKNCELSIEVSERGDLSKEQTAPLVDPQLPLPNLIPQPHNGRLLRREFTFDQFVVGGNNDFAYTAALSLACIQKPSQNTLFLLANPGLGKSHLSQAVGHHILNKSPSERVYYTTAEDFAGEMIYSFKNKTIEDFKEKYKGHCDVLLLEDIHFLSGKERTQIELHHILESLLDCNKKVIFTSCHQPSDIPKLNDKLRSRLSSSLISNIDPPDFSTRVKILKKKMGSNTFDIPEEVIYYLADELTEDVRQLESGLTGVVTRARLMCVPVDLGLARSVVKNMVRHRKNITMETIKKLVCTQYRVSIDELVSRSRKQTIVRPRQIAMYLARRYTDATFQEIGKSFNRYHATTIHSVDSIERELKDNGQLQKQVEFLCQKLESGAY
ncbi:MAG: chromosomal replication initiator protein DnaA [Pseudomonadota bacterium]